MVVAQNRAADDGQIRVGAEEIVRELLRKIQQPPERRAGDAHGRVRRVQDDAVLVVIDIRRVLQVPVAAVQLQRDDAVVLPGRVVHAARVALVFRAQGAFGVAGLRRVFGSSDGARVLFGLGQVDGDVKRSVFAGIRPLLILRDAVAADIVGILAEAVEPVGRFARGDFIERAEAGADLMRSGRENAHELRVEQIARGLIVRAHAARNGVVRQSLQKLGKRRLRRRGSLVKGIKRKRFQQRVAAADHIVRLDQPRAHGVLAERGKIGIEHGSTSFLVCFIIHGNRRVCKGCIHAAFYSPPYARRRDLSRPMA